MIFFRKFRVIISNTISPKIHYELLLRNMTNDSMNNLNIIFLSIDSKVFKYTQFISMYAFILWNERTNAGVNYLNHNEIN